MWRMQNFTDNTEFRWVTTSQNIALNSPWILSSKFKSSQFLGRILSLWSKLQKKMLKIFETFQADASILVLNIKHKIN